LAVSSRLTSGATIPQARLGYWRRLAGGAIYSVAKGAALPLVRPAAVRSGAHGMVYPVATYSPWLADDSFRQVYESVSGHTLVDDLRCWELWTLLGELRDVPGAILEVGVWRGGTGALMSVRASMLGIRDPVYLCDTWEGVVKAGEADPFYHDGEHSDASRQVVERLLQQIGAQAELLQGVFPDETAQAVEASSLRLAHIDVDVYRSAADALAWIWPRLSPNGVVVFDDYGAPATMGVAQLVDEHRELGDRSVVHNLNGHALMIKRC
jgi:O-methyltransferase